MNFPHRNDIHKLKDKVLAISTLFPDCVYYFKLLSSSFSVEMETYEIMKTQQSVSKRELIKEEDSIKY